MKRLLLLSASSGNGHTAAAKAVRAALRDLRPDLAVRHVDLLDLVSHPLMLLARRAYDACVNRAPFLWELAYRGADGGGALVLPDACAGLARRYVRLVARWRPDRILTTYWASGTTKAWVDRAAGRDVPVSVVITDAVLHRYWFHPSIDRYYVSDPSIRGLLVERGFPADRVRPTGIPAHPRFRPGDREAARRVLGLRPDLRWVVLAAGPRSMRELAEGVGEMLRRIPGLGVAVLTARDAALGRRLEGAGDAGGRLRVGGLVPDLERWMTAADLLVSKGGGLITSEATAVGVPLLVHRPIPGQEEANALRLQGAGAARVVADLGDCLARLETLLGPGGESDLAAMTAAARAIGRPEAAREIAASESALL